MAKSNYPKLMDKRVYEYYYDFCYVYERICDMVSDVIDPKSKEFESDESYKFVNCLGRYISRRHKESKKDQRLIDKNDYYKLLPEEIWEHISSEVEDWCSGVDNPYEDMMSDCFLEVLDANNFQAIPEGRALCERCTNKIKCQVATKQD